MKFTVNSTVLQKGLENIQGVVDKRQVTPILSHVRLQAQGEKGGQLVLNATDLDLDIVELIDTTVNEEGSTTVSASKLLDTAKNLPNNSTMECSLVNDHLHIKSGKFKATLNCLPVEDFPILKTNDLPNSFSVATKTLKHLIEQTKFAISVDEARYFLNGIYLHTLTNDSGVNVLRSVATDGHRLSLCEMPYENTSVLETGIIIPKKAVDELNKLLDKLPDENVEISSGSTKISFKFNKLVLTSKLIDGNFPNYTKVIPENNTINLVAKKDELTHALNLISVYSDDKLKSIKLIASGNALKISAKQGAIGEGEQELELENSVNDISIAFNAKYLKEIIDLIKTKQVSILLNTSNHPAIINKVEDKQQENKEIFIIMPTRV